MFLDCVHASSFIPQHVSILLLYCAVSDVFPHALYALSPCANSEHSMPAVRLIREDLVLKHKKAKASGREFCKPPPPPPSLLPNRLLES